MRIYLRKRKIFSCFILCDFFLFFMRFHQILLDFSSEMTNNTSGLKKIHGAPTSTANAPLLNLNLNYEKLQCKGTDY